MIRLDIAGARRLHLAAQGLSAPPAKPATKRDVLKAIRHMGALQIDTISVLERSPYFVLWTRVGAYPTVWLNQLLAEGAIFEYWSHAASFLPIEDYPLYQPFMRLRQNWHRWLEKNHELTEAVLAFVREHGEAKSSDFQRTEPAAGRFWDWKQEKVALECLFREGKLMTLRRDSGFQRIYAEPERVLRGRQFERMSAEDARRELAVRAVKHLGIARLSWVADYYRQAQTGMRKLLDAEVERGTLLPASVDGWDDTLYVHPANATAARSAARGTLQAQVTTILTPFDPVVWHRPRARELFDFEYQIEVYTPIEKRRYGYFNLPILHRDRLVGRLDAKAHRAAGTFEVRELHLEDGIDITQHLLDGLGDCLTSCAHWHGTPEVRITAKNDFGDALASSLA